jgi:hypothetical protein
MRLIIDDPTGSACQASGLSVVDQQPSPWTSNVSDEEMLSIDDLPSQQEEQVSRRPSVVSLYNESINEETGEWETERTCCAWCNSDDRRQPTESADAAWQDTVDATIPY